MKPTKNRKYVTKSDLYFIDAAAYEVNQGKTGIYTPILRRFIVEMQKSLLKYRRVFALRFDLHHKGITTPDNKWVSKFMKNLRGRITRQYGVTDIGYLWVREHERGKAQHYHVVLLMDGDIIQHPAKLNILIDKTWVAINPVNTVFHPENQFYFVDSAEVERELVYRVSYMAKVRGKGYRSAQVKDFYASRLEGERGAYCNEQG